MDPEAPSRWFDMSATKPQTTQIALALTIALALSLTVGLAGSTSASLAILEPEDDPAPTYYVVQTYDGTEIWREANGLDGLQRSSVAFDGRTFPSDELVARTTAPVG